ncbi:MAG: hypothetical protein Q7S22_05125 [Candidatus Micrarchaeota archaeon]|nr:hypothetical protein [Candidatus Micrarchaeota archaeon]
MTVEIPYYGLRAYALFFTKYGTKQQFSQSELDWIVSQSMKKKIFSLLLRTGWITKNQKNRYTCTSPDKAIKNLLEFKVPETIKEATKPYAFTGLSAIEIWSDYVYVQRGVERSPYFVKILKKDLTYWKRFFNTHKIPNYLENGSTIGEFIILIPTKKIETIERDGLKVEPLSETMKEAKENQMYAYPYGYMLKKYGAHR